MFTTPPLLTSPSLSASLGFEVLLISMFGYESLVSLDAIIAKIEYQDHCTVMCEAKQGNYTVNIKLNDDTPCYDAILQDLAIGNEYLIHGNLMQAETPNCYDLWVNYMERK